LIHVHYMFTPLEQSYILELEKNRDLDCDGDKRERMVSRVGVSRVVRGHWEDTLSCVAIRMFENLERPRS
jgi:hypothetical protein